MLIYALLDCLTKKRDRGYVQNVKRACLSALRCGIQYNTHLHTTQLGKCIKLTGVSHKDYII